MNNKKVINGKFMEKNFPAIKTEQLVLRQFTNDDLENVFHGLSHPDVIKYYGISFSSLEAAKEQITWFRDLEQNNTGIWWAICSKDDNSFLGGGGLNDLDHENRKAEVGFWLMPEYWGKGTMKEVMPYIYKYGFESLSEETVMKSTLHICLWCMHCSGFTKAISFPANGPGLYIL
jgi:ribosomal-protein-alanine N-acetyltransferase